MSRARRSVKSKVDYLEIWLYVAERNKDAADDLLRSFDKAIDLLADFPGLGTHRDDLKRGVLTYPVGNYLVLYRRVDGGIEVIRVAHGARDLRRLFRPSK